MHNKNSILGCLAPNIQRGNVGSTGINMEKEFIQLDDGMRMKNIENNSLFSVDYLEIEPGSIEENVYHDRLVEWLYILEGELEFYLDKKIFSIKKGESVFIDKYSVHGSVNKTSGIVKMLSVCSPPFEISDMKKCD